VRVRPRPRGRRPASALHPRLSADAYPRPHGRMPAFVWMRWIGENEGEGKWEGEGVRE
jgi:hypothetical protein